MRYPQRFLVQKRRPIENGVIPPEHKELNDKEIVQKDEVSHSTKSIDASINVSNTNDDNVEKNKQKNNKQLLKLSHHQKIFIMLKSQIIKLLSVKHQIILK